MERSCCPVLSQNQRLKLGLFQFSLFINRRKEDRALPANVAFDEFVARHLGNRRAVHQFEAREDHLRGGGADINTDAQQLARVHECASASLLAGAGTFFIFWHQQHRHANRGNAADQLADNHRKDHGVHIGRRKTEMVAEGERR
ncbi:Uncharacterised protein [Klebsiella aerogenes]|nr:Uncharacterised protein [Klebsiella aerogenes]